MVAYPVCVKVLPQPSPLASHWLLDPQVVFLNHGSFGACPRAVLDAQVRYRVEMEREPVRFFVESFDGRMDAVRAVLGPFVGAAPGDITPVPNATTGVATALENARLGPGDEILINDHEYPACCNAARRMAARRGATVVSATLPFPVRSEDEIVAALLERVSPRTKVALVSHVTSSSGLVLPAARIVRELKARGVETVLDGAHAPGFLAELAVAGYGAYAYAANCHKWICSPKGSAVLHVRPDAQEGFRPLVLSNFAEKPKPGRRQFHTEFDYTGTMDVSAWLSIADAIAFMGGLLPGGWAESMRRNREMVLRARRLLCETLGAPPPCPDEMVGCTATLIIPTPTAKWQTLMTRPSRYHDALQDALIDRHGIQVPVWNVGGRVRVLRISAQLYNSWEQYEHLASALREELARE